MVTADVMALVKNGVDLLYRRYCASSKCSQNVPPYLAREVWVHLYSSMQDTLRKNSTVYYFVLQLVMR